MKKFFKSVYRLLSDICYYTIAFMFTKAFICIAWTIIISLLIISLIFV